MKLAAIDIGSNAARLLINDVVYYNGKAYFDKVNLVRVPLRLGFDVFEKGEVTADKADMLMNTMQAFSFLMKAYGVTHVKAAATSAMRDAANGRLLAERVKQEAGFEIEIITGDQEAAYIYQTGFQASLGNDNQYVYIDVGGGSTELNFFRNGKFVYRESFKIGTIRLLKDLVTEADWNHMKDVVKAHIKAGLRSFAIGSGGNINKVFSLSKRKEGKPLPLELLRDYYKEFSACTLEQRIHFYNLKEDRADVIVPALQIYINIMKWGNIEEIYVPKIGLADGLIAALYNEVAKVEG
jgi:exopolyphosphatase/guanosine-5'-triphosphate,3'-diphosphate pyrophosphatase